MASALSWPAFSGIQGRSWQLPQELRVRRGIWGKVHGARTDFRWIAQSSGFGHGAQPLEKLFWMGLEEQPTRAAFWRATPARWLAISAYPSRAVDWNGRRGFCERQVLEWTPDPTTETLPAAAAALLLLPRAETFDDSLWWDQALQLADSPDLVLPLVEDRSLYVQVDEIALADAVRRGLDELRSSAADGELLPGLAALYTALRAGQQPALLSGLLQPLSGVALATLLLLLPREQADRLSLAGWLFAHGVAPSRLADNWDVVALPPPAGERSITPDDEGLRMAEALLAGEPPGELVPLPRAPRASAAVTSSSPIQSWISQPQAPQPSEPPEEARPLAAPGPEAPAVLHEIFRFASAGNRRWLAPEAIAQVYRQQARGGALAPADRELLCGWIAQLATHRPPHADADQWLTKVDLLRALALALAPSPEILDRLGSFASQRVPPLLYAPIFQAGPEMLRDRLGDAAFRAVAKESRGCHSPRWRQWVEEWLAPPSDGL